MDGTIRCPSLTLERNNSNNNKKFVKVCFLEAYFVGCVSEIILKYLKYSNLMNKFRNTVEHT
jgi:hypothetical protein